MEVYFNRPKNVEDLRQRIHSEMEQISPALLYKVLVSAKCKVPIFFIHRLVSSKVRRYEGLSERGEKSGGCHLKKILMTSLLGDAKLST
jgi:hypothetical protein